MEGKKLYSLYDIKNKCRIKYNYRMNQMTNTFLGKEYRPDYKKYCGRPVMVGEEANKCISAFIESGNPFWVGRFGNTELNFINSYLGNKWHKKTNDLQRSLDSLCNNAGFFPNDIDLAGKYVDLILKSCTGIDVHGMWPLYMEDYYISRYVKKSKLMHYVWLEPWALRIGESGVKPWSHSLKGKKILVIHPFVQTIQSQYRDKRELIFAKRFENPDDILPQFELKTLKAVQTIAGNKDERFGTWFEALDWMIEQCRDIDFDVAIIGCGAYSLPLAAEIKRMGKGVIQLCGATQLMFGIMGNRWKGRLDSLANEAWTYPNENEKVENVKNVENACYW
jgi:hypothetical protein